jgi:hypothetical protein
MLTLLPSPDQKPRHKANKGKTGDNADNDAPDSGP